MSKRKAKSLFALVLLIALTMADQPGTERGRVPMLAGTSEPGAQAEFKPGDALVRFRTAARSPTSPRAVIHVPGDYSTIAEALDAAEAGDTVQVAAGTYDEGSLSIPTGVHLVGAGWQGTIIRGSGSGVVVCASDGTLIEGFTIRNSGPDYFDAGVWISQGTATLRESRITGNSAGLWAWCFEPATCNIQMTLEKTIVDGNTSNGINSNEYAEWILRNNTLALNGGAGVILNNEASHAEDNIIAFNTGDGLVNNAGATTNHNDAWGNSRNYAGSGPGVGDLSSDPLFRDAGNGDYRLHAGSPAIGFGTPGGTDMGAVPFVPVGTPPASVALTEVNADTWDLSWTGVGAAGYMVYYGSCTRRTTTVVDAGAVSSFQISGITADEVGYAAVSAYDAALWESDVQLAGGVSAPCPSAPEYLEPGAFPGGQIRLQWQETSPLEEGFELERGTGDIGSISYGRIDTLLADTTVYTDTPPLNEETYWYRIQAYNANGSSPYSNETYNATFYQVPNLDEQYLLVLINEARADPGAFGYPAIDPVPPLAYHPLLNYAAHSHSQAIINSGFQIGHCDPAGRCPSERAHAVGYEGGVGENLIAGMDGPEWVESSNQAFMDSEGHRNNMLCDCFNEAGLGHTFDPEKGDQYWHGQYTETFCGRSGVVIPHLPSGIVVPYAGTTSTEFTYVVNYYHGDGYAPIEALAYIDNIPYEMSLSTGEPSNGTYRYTTTLSADEHNFYFHFAFSGGEARLPEGGSYPYPDILGSHVSYLPVVVNGSR